MAIDQQREKERQTDRDRQRQTETHDDLFISAMNTLSMMPTALKTNLHKTERRMDGSKNGRQEEKGNRHGDR